MPFLRNLVLAPIDLTMAETPTTFLRTFPPPPTDPLLILSRLRRKIGAALLALPRLRWGRPMTVGPGTSSEALATLLVLRQKPELQLRLPVSLRIEGSGGVEPSPAPSSSWQVPGNPMAVAKMAASFPKAKSMHFRRSSSGMHRLKACRLVCASSCCRLRGPKI